MLLRSTPLYVFSFFFSTRIICIFSFLFFRYKEEGGPSKDEIPTAESLSMVIKRLMPYWEGTIVPAIKAGKKVLIVAHGSSLRSLVKHLEGLTDAQVFFACFYSFFGN